MQEIIQRRHRAKKWGQIYTQRVEHIIEQRDKKLERFAIDRHNDASSVSMSVGLDHDDDNASNYTEAFEDGDSTLSLGTFIRTCKHTVQNVHPPPNQLNWNIHWGTQLLCYICATPAFNDCIVCSKCNLIAHILCADAAEYKLQQRPKHKLFTLKNKVGPAPEHTCPECKEAFETDLSFYNNLVQSLKDEKLRLHCASVITKRAMIFLEKRRATRKKLAVVMLQALFRGKLTRLKYLQDMRSWSRIVILRTQYLPKVTTGVNAVVVITVQDTFKDSQLFRYDKTYDQALNEAILIPGITWYMTIVVTIGVKDENQSYFVAGQAQLCLRDLDNIMNEKDIYLPFIEKISWMPQEVHGSKHFRLVNPVRPTQHYFEPTTEFGCSMTYLPQNPITSLCFIVFAPPLDILKRSADLSVKKKKSDVAAGSSSSTLMYRNSRYWLCLHSLKIWFFQYYTDASPRFGSNVSEANVTILCDKGRPTSLINLQHADQRSWVLEFSSRQDAFKFELALNESKKALYDKSIYTNGEEFSIENNFGFNIPVN